MVSKNEIKLITSLQQKKYRNIHQLFVVEGLKSVKEFINSNFDVYKIYTIEKYSDITTPDLVQIVSPKLINRLSNLKMSNGIVGIFRIPEIVPIINEESSFVLVLDGVKDPGNLGTIIRLCDWFAIPQLVCSNDTVDCYNPKVVQATMGSLTRVKVVYTDINVYLKNTSKDIYISVMDGNNVYKEDLPKNAVLIMGNEANGIRTSIQELGTKRISIPRFSKNHRTESLNVATASAILLSEFKR